MLAGNTTRLYPRPAALGANFWLIVTGYLFYGWAEPRLRAADVSSRRRSIWLMSLVIAPQPPGASGGSGANPFRCCREARARSRLQRSAITVVRWLLNLAVLGFFKYFNLRRPTATTRFLSAAGATHLSMGHRVCVWCCRLGNQLLHLPGALLHDRRLSRRRGGDDETSSISRAFVSMVPPPRRGGPILKFSFSPTR